MGLHRGGRDYHRSWEAPAHARQGRLGCRAGRARAETNKGPERVSHPRRNTTRVIDTELLKRSTRVGIVTGREKGAGHRRVLGSRIRSPGTKIGTSSCILYRSEGPCPLFYTCTNRNIKRENSPVQILKLAVFVTITNLGLLSAFCMFLVVSVCPVSCVLG